MSDVKRYDNDPEVFVFGNKFYVYQSEYAILAYEIAALREQNDRMGKENDAMRLRTREDRETIAALRAELERVRGETIEACAKVAEGAEPRDNFETIDVTCFNKRITADIRAMKEGR